MTLLPDSCQSETNGKCKFQQNSCIKCAIKKSYTVYEHLQLPDRGFRFWSLTSNYNDDWYKVVHYTDDVNEAIMLSNTRNECFFNSSRCYEICYTSISRSRRRPLFGNAATFNQTAHQLIYQLN